MRRAEDWRASRGWEFATLSLLPRCGSHPSAHLGRLGDPIQWSFLQFGRSDDRCRGGLLRERNAYPSIPISFTFQPSNDASTVCVWAM